MEELWDALNERLNWPMLNRIIRDNDLPTGQGKTKTWDKLKTTCLSSTAEMNKFKGLKKNLEQAVLFRDKYLRYFDIDDVMKTNIIDHLNQQFGRFQPRTSGIGQAYPLPDDQSIVTTATQGTPELIRFSSGSDGVCMVFSTVRLVKVRENIKGQFSGIPAAGFVDSYNEVIGIKTELTQFYDVINIDTNRNIVEFRMDNRLGSPLKQLELHYGQLVRKAISILGTVTGTLFNRKAHNFHSMIQKLYANNQEGMVKEMAFLTDEDSLKHEKSRYETGVDLREDGYHKNGKNGVVNMDFYRLGVSWDQTYPLKNTINLAVLGKYYMLKNSSGPFIDSAFVRYCHCAQEYNFILDIIRQYQ